MRHLSTIMLVILCVTAALSSTVAVADPAPRTVEQVMAEIEKMRLQKDPSDRPFILSGPLAPSSAAEPTSVSVDCGRAQPRMVNGRPRVRCTVTTTTVVRKDANPVESEISDLLDHGTAAFTEGCAYLAGTLSYATMIHAVNPASYCLGESRCWSGALAVRLDAARSQQIEGQRVFLTNALQACQAKDKDRFVQAYIAYLRQVEEHTCSVSASSESVDFEKVDANIWVASPSPSVCGETRALTLWRNPPRNAYSEPWNYKDVSTYPPSGTGFCASSAGKTMVDEFLVVNHRLRDLGCRYFDL
jgi:hypothetical protein